LSQNSINRLIDFWHNHLSVGSSAPVITQLKPLQTTWPPVTPDQPANPSLTFKTKMLSSGTAVQEEAGQEGEPHVSPAT